MAQHKRSRVAFDRLVYLLQDAPPETLVASRPLYLYGDLPSEQELDQRGREPWHASQDRANHAVKVGAERSRPGESRDAYGSLEALEVRNLTFHYPGSRTGIEGISFTVRRGEFVVVTGRVGSGKTTLVRVLLGLLPMESGEILWNGRPVQDPASFFVPPRSAYTPQVPRLLSETLRENILLGNAGGAQIDSAADISRERALENALEKALDLAVLRDDIAGLERGLDTLVGNRGVKLSGGQVQRAAAARMFVREAELMVFDDLSSALDVQTEQSLWTSLFAEREATCLVVSHRPVALWRATRVIVLDEGRLVATGTPEELAAENLLLVDRGEKGINGISGV